MMITRMVHEEDCPGYAAGARRRVGQWRSHRFHPNYGEPCLLLLPLGMSCVVVSVSVFEDENHSRDWLCKHKSSDPVQQLLSSVPSSAVAWTVQWTIPRPSKEADR